MLAVSSGRQSVHSFPRRIAAASPARILIVDDETSMRDFVDEVLRGAGYLTVRAFDGQDALDIAKRLGPFDLLLTDELMPRIAGHELARQLRQRQRDLKVLYLTGYTDRLFTEKHTWWACEAFLDKPATADQLLEAVACLLSDD
jgi:CheY-like chemotaxis protein